MSIFFIITMQDIYLYNQVYSRKQLFALFVCASSTCLLILDFCLPRVAAAVNEDVA